MRSIRRKMRVLATAAALGVALTACSSQGGAQEEAAGGGGGTGGSVGTERYTVAMITHEAPGDSFWDKIRAGAVALEARCAGVAQGTETENLQVEGTDLPSVRSTIGAKLQQDPSITHIVTLGAPIALAALDARSDVGSQAEVITFDLNADVAQRIQAGDIAFSIDQQPYVQGYLAVSSLWLHLTNGNDIGGGGAVLTGPSFVDSENIEQILPYAQNNTR